MAHIIGPRMLTPLESYVARNGLVLEAIAQNTFEKLLETRPDPRSPATERRKLSEREFLEALSAVRPQVHAFLGVTGIPDSHVIRYVTPTSYVEYATTQLPYVSWEGSTVLLGATNRTCMLAIGAHNYIIISANSSQFDTVGALAHEETHYVQAVLKLLIYGDDDPLQHGQARLVQTLVSEALDTSCEARTPYGRQLPSVAFGAYSHLFYDVMRVHEALAIRHLADPFPLLGDARAQNFVAAESARRRGGSVDDRAFGVAAVQIEAYKTSPKDVSDRLLRNDRSFIAS